MTATMIIMLISCIASALFSGVCAVACSLIAIRVWWYGELISDVQQLAISLSNRFGNYQKLVNEHNQIIAYWKSLE